jgi:succinate dehydrogenase / fumarate reductase flavoprotein subunit
MIYDVLIIGSGGAALSAALKTKMRHANIIVVSEGFPTRSQTCMAQGGINAALANITDDSPALHAKDTFRAAAHIASESMIERMCQSGPEVVRWLDSIGVPFSRTDNGKIAQRKLGGTSAIRSCYSQDYTGLKILHTLYDQTLKEEIPLLHEHLLLELSVHENRISGALFYDIREGKIKTIRAKSVILATGGYSALYHGFTTNTYQTTGDGIVAALKAGATVSNMEFVQFHPTALKGSGVLISESARGAGGRLVNEDGERFVDELKPRDVVSRAIWHEISRGKEVFLDIRHLGESFIEENIPQERKLCKSYAGIDPVDELIPIAPVAHYSMGGIDVDETLMGSIDGLFAVGECANAHIHGANRLGGNSLLEIVSLGLSAGEHAVRFAKERVDTPRSIDTKQTTNTISALLNTENSINFYERRETLGKLCYTEAGIVKERNGLEHLLDTTDAMIAELPQMGLFDKGNIYNTNLTERIKFENTLMLARVVTQSALAREESRGAHYRTDFPEPNPRFAKESRCRLDGDRLNITFEEVRV